MAKDVLDDLYNESHKKVRRDSIIKIKDWTYQKKLSYAKAKIREFVKFCKLNKLEEPVVSFSGGKDSVVIYHLTKQILKKNPTIVVASELFHPENAKFISKFPNKIVYPPLESFDNVIKNHGFPMISKEISQKINAVRNCKTLGKWIRTCLGLGKGRRISRKYLHFLDKKFVDYELTNVCCNLIKGQVKKDKRPKIVGTTIWESQLRRTNWINKGCNILEKNKYQSRPISIWNENDVWKFINDNKLDYSLAYNQGWKKGGMGWERTGCTLCGYGLGIECAIRNRMKEHGVHKPNRLELLRTHYLVIYNNYVWKKKMYRPLMDSMVTIENDNRYMTKYLERERERERWYSNLKVNLNRILNQIEKDTKSKFLKSERVAILKSYCGVV